MPIQASLPAAGEEIDEPTPKPNTPTQNETAPTSSTAKTQAKPNAKRVRLQNPLFDAIAEITGLDGDTSAGGQIGKIAAELSKGQPLYTADDVHEFHRRFWEICQHAAKDKRKQPYPGEVGKYIGRIRSVVAQPNIQRPAQDRNFLGAIS